MPMPGLRVIVLAASVLLSAASTACSQAGAPTGDPAPSGSATAAPAPAAPRRDRNRLTREDLASRTEPNLLALLQSQRPVWLRARGRDQTQDPVVWVYRDGVRVGGVEALRQIQTSQVREIQYLDFHEAVQRYGMSHSAGAILVTTI